MKSPPRPHRREPGVTRWLLLGGALCALFLALATRDSVAQPREGGQVRRASACMTRRPPPPRLMAHPEAPSHAALELSHAEHTPVAGHKRCAAWQGLAPGWVWRPAAGRGQEPVHGPGAPRGHRADRPLVVNCPARGPPAGHASSSR